MGQKFIPLSVPNLKGNELEYVTEAVKTEWVSSGGPFVVEFEERLAEYVQSKGAVSCQNGTSGLHTALLTLGVTDEHAVIVPTLTFIAAVNPVKYVGAEPLFMDCDDSLTIDMDKLSTFCDIECEMVADKLIHKKTQKWVKALIVVHVFGNMADMERLLELSEKYKFEIVEDATEALGTYYTSGALKGKYAGTMGSIGVYSFNGNKIVTTGGGGMLVSDNPEYLKRARHLTTQAKSDELYYLHDEIGYNYRMTNIQAALGLGQLEMLETFIQTKKKNYDHYKKALMAIDGLLLLPFRDDIRPNYWFYSLYVEQSFSVGRDALIQYFDKNKIQTRPIWGLIHEQEPYKESVGYEIERANVYREHIVNIPCSTNLTSEDVERVLDVINTIRK